MVNLIEFGVVWGLRFIFISNIKKVNYEIKK